VFETGPEKLRNLTRQLKQSQAVRPPKKPKTIPSSKT
jgi:hypothetical protein